MSVFSKIQNYQRSEWYPFQGRIALSPDGRVKIMPDPKQTDIFILVDEHAINEDFIHPKVSAKGSSSSDAQYEFHVKKGSSIELHYKNIEHKFKLDPNEKNFYIDPKTEQIVFLENQGKLSCTSDKTSADDPCLQSANLIHNELHTANNPHLCCQWIHAAWSGCCSSDHDNGHNYGWVECQNPAEPTMIGCNYNPVCCP